MFLPMTAYERRVGIRSLTLGSVLSVVVLALLCSTGDEGLGFFGAVGRLGPLAPFVGAASAAICAGQARSRGEWTALLGLGVSPLQVARGAIAGGFTLALSGILLVLVPKVSVTFLFPRVESPLSWSFDGKAFQAVGWGVALDQEGTLGHTRSAASGLTSSSLGDLRLPSRASIVTALSAPALALPLWSALERSWGWTVVVLAFSAIAGIVAFHIVSLEMAPSWVLAAPALAPLLRAALRGRL